MRLIDADKLDWWYKGRNIRRVIDEAPTIDAEPVRHGHWILKIHDEDCDGGYPLYHCSVCGKARPHKRDNYCPNCGAKMDEEVEHETD